MALHVKGALKVLYLDYVFYLDGRSTKTKEFLMRKT